MKWPRRRVVTPALLLIAALPASSQGSPSMTGISRAFNPAISANALFDAVYAGDGESDEDADGEDGHSIGSGSGLRVREVELQLSAIVDAYLKTDLILAFPGGEDVELEEGFVTTQSLPAGLQLKMGRFYAAFGRHNLLHTHQYPLLNPPLAHKQILGDEGLADDGISMSWLSPLPWYVELTGQVLDGRSERFASEEGEDLVYLAHARSFWDIGDEWTVEMGGSYVAGANAVDETSSLVGVDGTVHWRNLSGWGRRLIWQTEYLRASDGEAGGGEAEEGGLYSSLQVQLARRWWLQGRFDRVGLPGDEEDWRASALVGFVPSEFSAVRLQLDRHSEEGETSYSMMLQLNVTLGSHPAHRY